MIVAMHWDMKQYMHELSKDDKNPKAHKGARLAVLLQLMLHANHRLRCWPSTAALCRNTGLNRPAIVEARQWLINHRAVVIVPHDKREGVEKELPNRQMIYQLTGVVETSAGIVPYMLMSDEVTQAIKQELDAIGSHVSKTEISETESSVLEPKGITSIQDSTKENMIPAPQAGAGTAGDATPHTPSKKKGDVIPMPPPNTPPPGSAEPPSRRDPIFDAVCSEIFGIKSDEELKAAQEQNNAGTRIGMIAAWLNQKRGSFRLRGKTVDFGLISAPAKPDHVRSFVRWYQRKQPRQGLPRDIEKFIEYWREWASSQKARVIAPIEQPEPEPEYVTDPELVREMLRQVRSYRKAANS